MSMVIAREHGSPQRTFLAVLGAMVLAGPWVALAQESGGVLQEVVVTATRREQSVQDVGIAIDAFGGVQLQDLNIRTSVDVANVTPGVFVGGSIGGQTSLFTIRGVTQNDFTDSVESPVAVYVDEAYIAMAQGQNFGLFDLDRVEVAKGPQGTLFGRNATGGLVHYITRGPTKEADAYADASFSRFSDKRFEGAISGPLGGIVSGRLAVMWNKSNPILSNVAPASQLRPTNPAAGGGQPEWNDDTAGFRGKLRFELSDTQNLNTTISYQRTHTSTAPYVNSATVPVYDQQGRLVNTVNANPTENRLAILLNANGQDTGLAVPLGGGLGVLNGCFVGGGPPPAACTLRSTSGGDAFGYVQPKGLVTGSDFAYADINRFDNYFGQLSYNWKITDGVQLALLSNYMKFKKFVTMDVDAAPESQSIYHARSDESTYSEEARLSGDWHGTKWVGGLYYLNIENYTVNGLGFPAASPFATDPLILGAPGPVDTPGFIHLHTISTSVFGQVDYPLVDRFTLVAGARGVKERKHYSFFQGVYQNVDDRLINTSVLYAPLFPFTPFASDNTLWAGKLQLEFRPEKDQLAYVGINRGAKAGGFNAQLADGSPRLPLNQIPYRPESLLSYEAGYKTTLLGGRARLNGDVFHYDYKDYQAFLFQQSSGVVVNKNAETTGAEIEGAANVTDRLEAQLGVSVFDAKVKNLQLSGPPGTTPLFIDVKPSFAPERQVFALLRYTLPLTQGRLTAQLDGHYTSYFYHNLRNFEADRYGGYTVANARMSYLLGSWDVSAFVQNFTDKRYYTIGYDLATLCGCNENAFGQPITAGVEVRYRFAPTP